MKTLPRGNARKRSLRQARYARAALLLSACQHLASFWLQTTGLDNSQQIPCEEYKVALRLLLGISPVSHLEEVPRKCTCGASLEEDPCHGIACKLNRRKAILVGHDPVANRITK